MISDKALHPLLVSAAEGEMIVAGTLLKGLSDEQIAWVVVENHSLEDGCRITLHAYWHDIFMVSKVVFVADDGSLTWGRTAT